MAEAEVSILKEALCNQFVMMKLYSELDEEREASATAASEALSVILRLQREKAAEKLEASQYKRMAEERMHHAEECIQILEEVIQQNEMEITSLKYRLECYRHKLSSLGVDIPDTIGISVCAKAYFSESNVILDDTCIDGFVRRNISLPSLLCLDQMTNNEEKMADNNEDNNPVPYRKPPVWRPAETNKVNTKLKALIQDEDTEEVGSCSKKENTQLSIVSISPDQESGPCSWYSTRGDIGRKSKYEQGVSCLSYRAKGTEKLVEIESPSSPHSEAESKNYGEPLTNHERRLLTQSKGKPSMYEIGTSRVDFEQLKLQLKQIEEGKILTQEDREKSEEQLVVLRNVVKQLNRLKTQIQRSASKRYSTVKVENQDHHKIVSFTEAVLSFWL